MNKSTVFKKLRQGSYKLLPCTMVLAALAACGGGGSAATDTASSFESNNGKKTTSPSQGKGNNLVNVSLDTTSTTSTSTTSTAPTDTSTTTTASASTPTSTSTTTTTTSTTPVIVAPFVCAIGAITCVEIASTGTSAQASVPVTFGQPFRAQDWKHQETNLVARDNFNASVPVQADEISSHRDGSARFAVVSAQVANLQPNEKRVISLFAGPKVTQSMTIPSDPAWNIELVANLFTTQSTLVTFGNRNGTTPGTPFLTGERITLKLVGATTETYPLTVSTSQAGGGFVTLTRIAEAFQTMINSQSNSYKAEKLGEGGGFENMWISPKLASGGAFQVVFEYTGQATISQRNLSDYATPKQFVAKPQAELKRLIGLGTNRRMTGGVAQEYTVVVPFKDATTNADHQQLSARLHTRLYEGGARIRTDVVIENNWAYNPNPGNLSYDLTFKQGGQTVYEQAPLTHYHHSRWRKTLWKGAEPKARVLHHMPYFMASKITWNYDLSLKVSETTLAQIGSQLASANTAPMGNALITQYFPMTGGRGDIGPLPRWTALFLVTQDDRARAAMLANADAAAGIPIHYRDAVTDHPIDLDRHPGVALRFGQSAANDALPVMANSATPWTVDTAHQGSFAFIPYIVTGDAFYLDEVMFWAARNMGAVNPEYRNYGEGLIFSDQVRGQAWALRSIGEAARALSDSHAMKNYFNTRLNNNLSWYVNRYPANSNPLAVSPLGAIEKVDRTSETAPWQNDFFHIVLSNFVEDGYPQAVAYSNWLKNFTVGRFQNETNGFCLAKAPNPDMKIRIGIEPYITEWNTLFQANWPGSQCDRSTPIHPDAYPNSPSGYVANARAMLGATSNAGVAGAAQAYGVWKSMTSALEPGLNVDPTWAIVPRQ